MSAHVHALTELETKMQSRPLAATFILFGGLFALVIGIAVSISVGAADINLTTVWEAIFRFNPGLTQHQIIMEIRMPRALAGALVGACFAVAGAIMQGMSRNPLADSGLLGLNSGSGFALALCFALFPGLPFLYVIFYSFVGAAVSAGLVYGVGSLAKGGLTPVRLVLAGAAVSALLTALSEGIAIYFQIGQDLAFWYAGGIAGTKWTQIQIIFPWVLLSRSINLLSLGEEVAASLGQRIRLVKLAAMIIVLVLAGGSVSAVGSIGFVGLVIPHVARYLVGVDYRWIIPCSAVLGSLLIVLADIAARLVHPPYETPIGALIALIGVPFFLYLARKNRRDL
jgi:iron complex transport system permease protein